MDIVAYCRVSTDNEDQLNSLDTQKRFFEDYAQRNGYQLVRIYADEGISGTKTKNRKQFLQLMRDSNSGQFQKVVTKDVSRFARNAVDFLVSIRELKAKGIPCEFVNANLSTVDGEFILGMFALHAQEESANTSKRIKFSKRLNAEKGRVPNQVFGYEKVPGDYFHLNVHPQEAAVVQRIYRMYLEGCGQNKIAMRLNEEGLRTKRGCKWSQNAVARILTNAIYTGKIINGKQEVRDFLTGVRTNLAAEEWLITDRPELAIIEPQTFEAVQRQLNRRREAFRITGERNSDKHVFSTLIRCAHCGRSFRRITRTYRNTRIHWVCNGRNQNGVDSCPNRTVMEEEELLQEIRGMLLSLLEGQPDVRRQVIREFGRTYGRDQRTGGGERELEARIAKLRSNREKYLDMHLNDILTMDELRERTKEINRQVKQAERELELARNSCTGEERLQELLDSIFCDIQSIVRVEDFTNSMLKRIIHKIEVDADGHAAIHLQLLDDMEWGKSIRLCDGGT